MRNAWNALNCIDLLFPHLVRGVSCDGIQSERAEDRDEPDVEDLDSLLGAEAELLEYLVTSLAPECLGVVPPRGRQVDVGGGHVCTVRLENRPEQ